MERKRTHIHSIHPRTHTSSGYMINHMGRVLRNVPVASSQCYVAPQVKPPMVPVRDVLLIQL